MLQTLLHFRNIDSTQDLNNQLSGFFQQGIVSGGDVNPVAAQLQVTVNPFKLIGPDGMVVLETTDVVTLGVTAGQTNVVCFQSEYIPNGPPVIGWQVLELNAYLSTLQPPYLTVFAFVTVPVGATQVVAGDISYQNRMEIDPVGRLTVRGTLTSATLLPTQNNRPGDSYIITSGLGDTPALYTWNGAQWLNITDTLVVASTLNAHRNNLFANEIHLTNEQAIAATGTYGVPGVETIVTTINIPTSTFTLSAPLSNNDMATGARVSFATSGTLPAGITAGTYYYAISLSQTQFRVATTQANALANIAITLGGIQSGIQTSSWDENKYVTSTDPRLPTTSEAGALPGFPSTPVPSVTNPYVTAAYVLASPASKLMSGVGPYVLGLSDGPVFVGTGGAGTAVNYFKFYLSGYARQYVDPTTGVAITVTGVYKDAALTQPLIPSSEPSVLANNGFYSGALYITSSSVISVSEPALLYYGQQQSLYTINRGSFLQPNINSAQTNEEVLTKFQQLSGRLFDTVIPFDEQNINLRIDLNNLTSYSLATTVGSLVLNAQEIPRLNLVNPTFASQFPIKTGEIVQVNPGTQFNIYYTASYYTDFAITPDLSVTAIISYVGAAPPTGLLTVVPGSIFVDGVGNRFRVLSNGITSGTFPGGAFIIYTAGQSVDSTFGPTSGTVYQGNNPRQLLLQSDHRTAVGREVIPINSCVLIPERKEILPPGGNATGPGASTTLIGQQILTNNGSAAGASAGRNLFNILPQASNALYDQRFLLIGGWEADPSGLFVTGQISQGTLGIEYTGYVSELTLMTTLQGDLTEDYAFDVFVDGSFVQTYYPLADGNLSTAVYNTFAANGEAPLQRLRFPLGLSLSQIHTVRIEVTTGGDAFPLSGIEIYTSQNLTIQPGNEYFDATLNQLTTGLTDTDVLQSTNTTAQLFGAKVVRYVDGNSGDPTYLNYTTATETFPYYYQTPLIVGSDLVVATGLLTKAVPQIQAGDVVYLTENQHNENVSTSTQYLLVVAGFPGSSTATVRLPITVPSGLSANASLEYAYRIPIASDGSGTAKVNAPYSPYSEEYNRMLVTDWDNGNSSDIAQSTVGVENSAVTVMSDQVTSLLMQNCTLVNTNIEGYAQGLSLSSTNSALVMQTWGTRLDLVFCGNQGATTVTVEIDGGQFSYQLALSGNGVEKHSVYYDASPQSRTVRIYAPTVTNKAVVAEWVMYDMSPAALQGVTLSSYTIARQQNNFKDGSYRGFAPTGFTGALVTSESGLVVRDITKSAILENGTNLGPWSIVQDFNVNPRFGYYMTTSQLNAYMQCAFTGPTFELYIKDDGNAGDVIQFYVIDANGVQQTLNSITYPTLVAYPGGTANGQFNTGTGQFKKSGTGNVMRIVVQGIPATQLTGISPNQFSQSYTLKVQNTVLNSQMSILCIGENAGVYQIQKRNREDTQAKYLNLSSFRDDRYMLTLLPDQAGGLGGGSSENSSSSVTAVSIPENIPPFTPSAGYNVMMSEAFLTAPSAQYTQINTSISNASWNSSKYMFSINAAQLQTVTTTGTAFTLAALVSNFTVKQGDIIYNYSTGQWRRIVTITGLAGTLDAAFSPDLAAASCMISQAVWTNDLVNIGPTGDRAGDAYLSANVPVVNLSYQDNATAGSNVPALTSAANVVCSASNAGTQFVAGQPLTTTFSPIYTRPAAPNSIPDYPLLANAPEQRLFLAFFANPANTLLTKVNLIRYDCSFYQYTAITNGGYINSAYAYNSGVATPVNCTNPVNSGGVTYWTFNWQYVMNVNAGTTQGDLTVQFNGQDVPRFVAGAMSSNELYYVEVNSTQIRFSSDIITSQPTLALTAKRAQGLNDQSVVNNQLLNQLMPITVGTPAQVAAGYAMYSSLQTALSVAPVGGRIVIYAGISITETVTVSNRVSIIGLGGYDTFINGTITLNNVSYATISGLRCSQFILTSGGGNYISDCFWTTAPSDTSTGSAISGITI